MRPWNWSAIPVERIAPGIDRQMIHGDRLFSPIREDLLAGAAGGATS